MNEPDSLPSITFITWLCQVPRQETLRLRVVLSEHQGYCQPEVEGGGGQSQRQKDDKLGGIKVEGYHLSRFLTISNAGSGSGSGGSNDHISLSHRHTDQTIH